jgi:hypothetical protein
VSTILVIEDKDSMAEMLRKEIAKATRANDLQVATRAKEIIRLMLEQKYQPSDQRDVGSAVARWQNR